MKTTSFRELCKKVSARIEIIVRFLALLELYKNQSVDLDQVRAFGEIVVRWRQPASRLPYHRSPGHGSPGREGVDEYD